jgi:hypothetical protein
MEQQELKSLRAAEPRLNERLNDIDKLNLPGLDHASIRARELLQIAARFQVSGKAQEEIDCYRGVAAYCDELERQVDTFKDFGEEVDKLLAEGPASAK